MVRVPPGPFDDLPEKWSVPVGCGLSCFPAKLRGKSPDIPWRSFQSAHPTMEQIKAWAQRQTNVAICTGAISGIIVLDLDSAEAVRKAERLGLPHTVSVRTAKGRHLFFRHPGGRVGNRAGIFPGADIRGDGGYVIAAGSIHPDGTQYEWINSPVDTQFADCPQWLLGMLAANGQADSEAHKARVKAPFSDAGNADAHWQASIQAELFSLRQTPNGRRNDQLNKSTFVLAQLTAGCGFDWQPVEDELRKVAYAIGLDAREIEATIRSAREKGFQNPRTVFGAAMPKSAEAHASAQEAEDALTPFPTLDLVTLASTEPHPKEFVIPGFAPAGEVTLFTGPGSSGKSLLSQQLGTGAAVGVETLRLELEQANTIYLTCEDDEAQLHWRQAHICAALDIPMESLAGKLHLVTLRGTLGIELCTFAKGGFFTLARAYHRLAALIEQTGAKLVFLDNVAHLFTGNENDRGDVTRFLNALNRLASQTGAAIVLLGHPNKQHSQGFKAGNQYSGSTAWQNAVRSQITLDHDQGTGLRTLSISKANYSPTDQTIRFFFINWAFVHVDDAPADIGRAAAQAMLARQDDARFLSCLRERTRQQRAVSERSAANYAPTVFAQMTESEGIGKERLRAALDRLWKAGRIERGELWKGSDRKMVVGIREVASAADGNGG
ncbi:AAA family ATPase [Sphingopyxis sp. Q841]|uniref:AAA family ATPase n=1 Tax=Sphingopyxis sp. Q841 TaxID=3458250 RepID=UPI0040354FCE